MSDQVTDGYMPFRGYKTYYKIVGMKQSDKLPLLILHGGPGGAHNYMLPLATLADNRQIIFYDQLGCGKSSRPDDMSLWTIQTFLDELAMIREHLSLPEIHLLGHSWGGMLAIEYLLTNPEGVKSVILASSMVSMPLYQKEAEKLKADLPGNLPQVMLTHEKNGTTDSEEYRKAYAEYHDRHLWRGGKWPEKYDNPKGTDGDDAYHKMWGLNEACANGDLKDWDRLDRLSEIKIPALITSGQYDELTPEQAALTHDAIAGSKLRIFTAGSHCVHIEREKEYVSAVQSFLKTVDE
jgi:proline-specific peptidase